MIVVGDGVGQRHQRELLRVAIGIGRARIDSPPVGDPSAHIRCDDPHVFARTHGVRPEAEQRRLLLLGQRVELRGIVDVGAGVSGRSEGGVEGTVGAGLVRHDIAVAIDGDGIGARVAGVPSLRQVGVDFCVAGHVEVRRQLALRPPRLYGLRRVVGLVAGARVGVQHDGTEELRLLKLAKLRVRLAARVDGRGLADLVAVPGIPQAHRVGGGVAGGEVGVGGPVVVTPEVGRIVGAGVRLGLQAEVDVVARLAGRIGKHILDDDIVIVVVVGEAVGPPLDVDAGPGVEVDVDDRVGGEAGIDRIALGLDFGPFIAVEDLGRIGGAIGAPEGARHRGGHQFDVGELATADLGDLDVPCDAGGVGPGAPDANEDGVGFEHLDPIVIDVGPVARPRDIVVGERLVGGEEQRPHVERPAFLSPGDAEAGHQQYKEAAHEDAVSAFVSVSHNQVWILAVGIRNAGAEG